ncbi:unnamed protein product [Linum trigynum]|uniref:DUF4283 domain-containing protein n=1 Tax=Linum trigynum TaxID=586398 RepID=A0AAV2CBW9_9ROSI
MTGAPPPVPGGGVRNQIQGDVLAGKVRPPTESSSPNKLGDRETQHTKKRAKPMLAEPTVSGEEDVILDDSMESPNAMPQKGPTKAWDQGTSTARCLFSDVIRTDRWYVADSDSEECAEAILEDGLEFTADEEIDPICPEIQFSAAEKRSFCLPWRSALVVKVLGRTTSYTAISRRLNQLWAKAGGLQITYTRNGFYLVRSISGVDYERAITGGPWMVGDNYLTVHMWHKTFDPYEREILSTKVWERLLEIPIQFFHENAVMKIAQRIGKPFRVDQATITADRGEYARVCMQVDLTKPLLSQFRIEGKKYFIAYEGLEKICLHYGQYRERTVCHCEKQGETQDQPMPSSPQASRPPEPTTP